MTDAVTAPEATATRRSRPPGALSLTSLAGAAIGGLSASGAAWSVGGGQGAVAPVVAAMLFGGCVAAVLGRHAWRPAGPPSPAPAPAVAEQPLAPQPLPSPATVQPVRAFSSVVDAVPHLVWQADALGVVHRANQTWLRNVRTLRPLRIEDMVELMVDDDTGAFIGAWDAAQRSGTEMRLRCRLRRPGSGEQRWTDVVVRPLLAEGGEVDGWLGTCTDVHDALCKIESAQQALREERRQREAAERLAVMKDEFLGTVSHELRSPLNAIAGWSEILSRERGLTPSAVHAIGIIQRNARSQGKLITDLQQLTSMLTGKVALTPTEFDLGGLAQDVMAQHGASAAARGVALVCVDTQAAPVHADAARIGQAIANLVSNAIKYTPAGGRVEVTTRRVRDSARVTVTDTGCGIAPERLPQLFDCLRPLDVAGDTGRPLRRDGLGIGLAVARGLVELHDGSVQAHSAGLGAGSVFTVTLPLSTQLGAEDMMVPAPAASPADRLPLPVAAGPSADAVTTDRTLELVAGLEVLVIDGDGDSRELIRVALSSLGARVTATSDAQCAVEALGSRRPDVLLCDAMLPTADAALLRDAMTALYGHPPERTADRSGDVCEGLPTIAMQAPGLQVNAAIAGVLPCMATLRKPVSLRRLASAIAAALAQSTAASLQDAPGGRPR